MSGKWANSNRRAELPTNWPALRRRILNRDQHRCTETTADGTRCTAHATDVDHTGDKHDHRMEMLRSLCSWHHDRKSSAQGNAAQQRRRPTPQHPGITD